jgi:hypothetical protein
MEGQNGRNNAQRYAPGYFFIALRKRLGILSPEPAVTESRLHDVAAKAAQVIGGLNLFLAVNGFFLS